MATALNTQPYKGARDFYPADMKLRQWMFQRLRTALQSHGFEEYDGPLLESFDLYASKTSEEIVNEQLYHFVDRGGRKLAIRPEMTPTLARMVAARFHEIPKPLRWYSIPNLWRYERPQRGRLREHWQLNVDLMGGDPSLEDFEILNVAISLMRSVGASPESQTYEIRVNHRGLTQAIFQEWLELTEDQVGPVAQCLDRAGKIERSVLIQNFQSLNLNSSQIDLLVSLLEPDALTRLESRLQESSTSQAYLQLKSLVEKMKSLGLGSVIRIDPSIMRGFTYYTSLVFEIFDLHPENRRALFGGGRYDNLVALFGAPTLSGVGFGMGDVTFQNFLEVHGLIPSLKTPRGIYVVALDESSWIESQKVCGILRGLSSEPVISALQVEKPRKAFQVAERHGYEFILFVGESEVQSQTFSLKQLATSQETKGTINDLCLYLQKRSVS